MFYCFASFCHKIVQRKIASDVVCREQVVRPAFVEAVSSANKITLENGELSLLGVQESRYSGFDFTVEVGGRLADSKKNEVLSVGVKVADKKDCKVTAQFIERSVGTSTWNKISED